MGGSTPQQPTQSTTTTLSPQAQQLFDAALPSIYQYASSVPQRYQGSTVAGFTPNETAGQGAIVNAAYNTSNDVNNTLRQTSDALQNFGSNLNWSPVGGNVPYDPTKFGPAPNYTPFVGQDLQTSNNIFSDPGVWNPAFNAGTSAAIDAAVRPIYQNLNENVLPGIRGSAVTAGGFGGSRQGIAEGLASGRASTAAGDTAAKIVEDLYGTNLGALNSRYATNLGAENQRYGTNVSADQARYATNLADQLSRYGTNVNADQARYATNLSANQQNYSTNINALLQSLGMIPNVTSNMISNSLVGPSTQLAVGDQQRAMEQALINQQVGNFNYDQLAPFLQARDIISLSQGFPGATTTSTGNVPQANPWLQSAGGALTGASAGAVFGPAGTAIGGFGGALLPWLTR
jgi:hypothetical protein